MLNLGSVKGRLILISAIVVFGMGAMLGLQIFTSDKLENLNNIELGINKVNAGMLLLRRHEKDFLMRQDTQLQNNFNRDFEVLDKAVNGLDKRLHRAGIESENVKNLRAILVNYQRNFNQLVSIQTQIGLDPESGLYGQLRDAVHQAESLVKGQQNYQLLADTLMLRRREKDFMLRHDVSYIEKFKQDFDLFMQHLQQADMPAPTKDKVLSVMNDYKTEFLRFSDQLQTLGLTPQDGLMKKVRETVQATEAIIETMDGKITFDIRQAEKQASILTFGLAFSLVIIVLVLVIVIARSISRPISYLAELMQNITSNKDLSLRYNYPGVEEINNVGHYLNDMMENFAHSMHEVTLSAKHLSESSQELNQVTSSTRDGVQRQQIETEAVATAMNEMTTTVQEVASSATQAAESSKEADKASMEGRKLVDDTIKGIRNLANQVINTATEIDQLRAETDNVNTVLQVIANIAEQTNLLALNAAIEAARAGEQGRGFAVVADEVRTLASRSQASTQEIKDIIERLQSKTLSAVGVMEQGREQAQRCVEQADITGAALEKITAAVSSISERNFMISSAAEEQNAVAEEINRNVINISDIANASTEAANQTLATSENLARLAVELQNVVHQFRL